MNLVLFNNPRQQISTACLTCCGSNDVGAPRHSPRRVNSETATAPINVHRSLRSQGVGRGCGVGLGLGMGVPLGVGLGRTVAVGVAVAVGVGVTEGVTVAEGVAVAVGVGVGPEGVILKGPLVEELFWKR